MPKILIVDDEDSGIGIPDGSIHNFFDILCQVDPSANRKYGGTGMGLAVTKDIIEAHRGIIRVESKEGECTSYNILLPQPRRIKNDSVIWNQAEATQIQKVAREWTYGS